MTNIHSAHRLHLRIEACSYAAGWTGLRPKRCRGSRRRRRYGIAGTIARPPARPPTPKHLERSRKRRRAASTVICVGRGRRGGPRTRAAGRRNASQPRVLGAGSDPIDDSRVLLFRFNSFGEPNPKATHRLHDSGGGKTQEIRQKCIQISTVMPSHSTLVPNSRD